MLEAEAFLQLVGTSIDGIVGLLLGIVLSSLSGILGSLLGIVDHLVGSLLGAIDSSLAGILNTTYCGANGVDKCLGWSLGDG